MERLKSIFHKVGILPFLMLLLFSASPLLAQSDKVTTFSQKVNVYSVIGLVLVTILLISVLVIYLFKVKHVKPVEKIKSLLRHWGLRPFLMLLLFSAIPLSAQTENGSGLSQGWVFYSIVGLVLVVAILVMVLAVYLLQILKAIVKREMTEEQRTSWETQPSWWARNWEKWNALKPLEEEESIMLDHDYDGIKELDNHLPPWWKALFYLSIVYAVVYLLIFHVFKTAPLQEEQYEIEMAEAMAARSEQNATVQIDFDESNVPYNDDAAALADGKEFFETQCYICHKADGGGLAGPNLTDDYWKHGGRMTDIYNTIKKGVPNTAMIAWESRLTPERLRNVASYVKSLRGTNPPGGLPPDGELYVPEDDETTSNQ